MTSTKYEFPVTRTARPKEKPDQDNLAFGANFTDHMFAMEYDEGRGWHSGRVVPYAKIEIDPASCVLHYAQMMFEGMKAYKTADGHVQLFRPYMNARRLNRTNERMCIPPLDEKLFVAAIKALVRADIDWVPEKPFTSLYIRPFIISDEVSFSVLPAKHYRFMIILCPSGPYYAANMGKLSATRIYVEDEYIRSAQGGTGFAKVGGNYAGGMLASQKAKKYNCKDVLWLDAKERRYVEEIGTSNAFFKIGDEVVTAPLSGTILPGVTRDSVITLLNEWGVPVRERRLSVDELFEASRAGELREVFATGTAAVISPIGTLCYMGEDHIVSGNRVGALSQKLYDTLIGIQTGSLPDTRGWIERVV
ncbi:MAG TPA: branched-chain amino acid aminotransferase [Clostridia bacterium]|jgi:branched-chain amino acid aminotransferase|nr:branched-chain amino acid aminotransferase [Clostridia bacterium]HPK17105.1 branched-chain amino acid aminotransferase [Clostridia bacterium]